jgi:predicted nucleotidyltransferase component of viral defense system
MTQPKRPTFISEYAQACLGVLSTSEMAKHISLGGAFGLAHYLEYRSTHDIDAWWVESITLEEQQQVIRLVEKGLRSFGEVRIRSWGDVTSIELTQEKKVVFSFQIARRSAELHSPISSPWGDVQLDTLDDLIASKMNALIERGAPRDFLDIHTLCQRNLCDVARCWQLWAERQHLSGDNADRQRAMLAVQTHIIRLEQARPLVEIANPEQRSSAEQVREWFKKEFLYGISS